MNMQTHPVTWGKSPCRERAALRSCRSLRECERRRCTWAVCSSGRWTWFLPPPEGTWPGQQQRRPGHRQIWLSTERWSPVHPCEGGLSWTQRRGNKWHLIVWIALIRRWMVLLFILGCLLALFDRWRYFSEHIVHVWCIIFSIQFQAKTKYICFIGLLLLCTVKCFMI